MNKFRLKKLVSLILCALFSATFVVVLFFTAPQIPVVPETRGDVKFEESYRDENNKLVFEEKTLTVGDGLAAVRIDDLQKLGKLTRVNYVPDEFVTPSRLSSDIRTVDLTKPFEFAEKGTLIFVVLSLDPWDENFDQKTNALSEYKIGDFWTFTLSLPKIFSASNVYVKSELVSRHGEIENYDFIDFTTSYDLKTEKFSSYTENTLLNLRFYTRRITMEDALNAAQVVTVHYQSGGGYYSGIADCPLIGTESAVKKISEHSDNLLIAFAIISALVFAVMVVLSLLKRTDRFVSLAVVALGVTFLLLSRFLLVQPTSVPLLWVALWLSSSSVILCGSLLSVGKNCGRVPLGYIFAALALVGALLSFIVPFVSYGAAAALRIATSVVKGVSAAAILAFTVLSALASDERNSLKTDCSAVIAIAVTASLFMPQVYPAYVNPVFWLCALTVILAFTSVFILFGETEKANAYLTDNLHLEVERQVRDIKAVIEERDDLLRFVSHDMKKPLVSSSALIDNLIAREKSSEQIKALHIVKQNTEHVINNLSEIGSYARFNYIAEASQKIDVFELCSEVCLFHSPDCNANGIVLKNLVDRRCYAYAKRQGLKNALSNIILNAVEHADCKTVALSLRTSKNRVVLSISDDGRGIGSDVEVFKMYSFEKPETGGVGLYICRNIIESMNGTLTYESGIGGTVFHISLLKA